MDASNDAACMANFASESNFEMSNDKRSTDSSDKADCASFSYALSKLKCFAAGSYT